MKAFWQYGIEWSSWSNSQTPIVDLEIWLIPNTNIYNVLYMSFLTTVYCINTCIHSSFQDDSIGSDMTNNWKLMDVLIR